MSLSKYFTLGFVLNLIIWHITCQVAYTNNEENYLIGHSLNSQGKFAEAIPYLDSALKSDPKYTDAYISRGFSFSKLGQYTKALADYEKAIKLDNKNIYALNNLGFTYLRLGEFEKAVANFNLVLNLEPRYEPTISNRAEAYLRLNKIEDSISDCDKAMQIDPADIDPYMTKAEIFMRKLDLTQALALYSQAINCANSKPSNSFHKQGEAQYFRSKIFSFFAEEDLMNANILGYDIKEANIIELIRTIIKSSNDCTEIKILCTCLKQELENAGLKINFSDNNSCSIKLNNQKLNSILFAKLMLWDRAYAVSKDTNKEIWQIMIESTEPAGSLNQKSAKTYSLPHLNGWSLDINLTDKPKSEFITINDKNFSACYIPSFQSYIAEIKLAKNQE